VNIRFLFSLGDIFKRGDIMIPERLNFLNRFDNFYQVIVDAVEKDKLNERDFYLIVGAKVKSMNQERREKTLLVRD